MDWQKELIKLQDKLASESKVFNQILQSERTNDIWSTNSPKSKTRNAIMIKYLYKTIDEWENDLLTNDFYKIKSKEE
jgi:hypothetical protein